MHNIRVKDVVAYTFESIVFIVHQSRNAVSSPENAKNRVFLVLFDLPYML